jgi:FkbM family methyltransferase
MKKLAAQSILFLVRRLGHGPLKLARRVSPLSLKRALSRFVQSAVTDDNSVLIANDGHKFRSIPERVFLHLRMEGYYEKDLSDLARQILETGDIVVDVGANFGWYSVLAASKVGEQGKVYSIEPNAKMYKILKDNLQLNGYENRVIAWNCGLGSASGKARLSAADNESGIGCVAKADSVASNPEASQEIEIRTLDEVAGADSGNIAFVKIDVEGYEPHVFAGGPSIFHHPNMPVIQVEFNVEALKRQELDVAKFAAELSSLPGQIYLFRHGKLTPVVQINHRENQDLFIFPTKGRFADRIQRLKP